MVDKIEVSVLIPLISVAVAVIVILATVRFLTGRYKNLTGAAYFLLGVTVAVGVFSVTIVGNIAYNNEQGERQKAAFEEAYDVTVLDSKLNGLVYENGSHLYLGDVKMLSGGYSRTVELSAYRVGDSWEFFVGNYTTRGLVKFNSELLNSDRGRRS